MSSQVKENYPEIILFFIGWVVLSFNTTGTMENEPVYEKTLSKCVIIWLLILFMAPEQEEMV